MVNLCAVTGCFLCRDISGNVKNAHTAFFGNYNLVLSVEQTQPSVKEASISDILNLHMYVIELHHVEKEIVGATFIRFGIVLTGRMIFQASVSQSISNMSCRSTGLFVALVKVLYSIFNLL